MQAVNEKSVCQKFCVAATLRINQGHVDTSKHHDKQVEFPFCNVPDHVNDFLPDLFTLLCGIQPGGRSRSKEPEVRKSQKKAPEVRNLKVFCDEIYFWIRTVPVPVFRNLKHPSVWACTQPEGQEGELRQKGAKKRRSRTSFMFAAPMLNLVLSCCTLRYSIYSIS